MLSGLDADFNSNDIAGAIIKSIEKKMAQELPDQARETIKKWTGKAYTLGLGQSWDGEKWKVTDKNALEFFEKHDQHFFGQQFEHYRDDMRRVVEDELKGKSAYSTETKKRMRDVLGEAFEHDKIKDYYDLCIRNAVNKSRNYGRIFQYERLGVAEVEIVAILDTKTSKICRVMNGRRMSVTYLADHVREVLKTPMNELTEKFAWPKPGKAQAYAEMSTDEILQEINCKLPPFHGQCRTTTVIGKKLTVKKAGGEEIRGITGTKTKLNTKRYKQIKKLTGEELKSKVSQQSTNAYWDHEGTDNFKKNETLHSPEFDSTKSYEAICKKTLESYNRVVTFNEGAINKWGFYNKEFGSMVTIDELTGKIQSMYAVPGFEKYLKTNNHYLEIL